MNNTFVTNIPCHNEPPTVDHYQVKDSMADLAMSSSSQHSTPTTPRRRLTPQQEYQVHKNYKFLVDNLDAEEVLDHMITAMVFSFEDRDNIVSGEGSNSRRGQTRRFLDCLLRAGENAYEQFLVALKEIGQGHIAQQLEDTGICQPPAYVSAALSFNPFTAKPHHLTKLKPKMDKHSSESDAHKPWITNIVVTHNGRLVMADRSNMKVKVTSMSTVSCVTLSVRPWALALLDRETVAVTSQERDILIVDVKEKPVVTQEIQTARSYRGVGCVDQHDTLIVSGPAEGNSPACIDVITRDGQVVRTIIGADQSCLSLPDYLFVVGGEVLVSDSGAGAVFRVSLSSGLVTDTLTGKHLKYPLQVCADRGGNIYVACHDSRCVLVMRDGGSRKLFHGDELHGDLLRVTPYCVTVTDTGMVWIGWGHLHLGSVLCGYQLQ